MLSLRLPVLALLGALALGACSSGEKYYRLSAEGALPANASGLAIGVGPVSIPDYIDRGELVFQSQDNRFEIPYEHRWAGNLRAGTTRVIGTNLARLLGTGNLQLYPWDPGTPMRYQVRVDIRQFHAVSGGDAILQCVWQIEDRTSRRTVVRKVGDFSEPVRGDGYEAIVAAQSRLLAQLARSIAASFPGR
ncbi:MAG: membrane integrity-associated transporter subunit PqiC [Verrucomicrobia bacterium]|nr:membrane integrity-associated transporter subunit PqiC [Verrucomicrobiota bacterium]